MDKDRQIRFLYPPLIFISSIALGIWLDCGNAFWHNMRSSLADQNTTSIAVGLLGIGSLVLVLGYLIGTTAILALRLVFFKNRFNYEFKLSAETYESIGKIILRNKNDPIKENERMYAAVVFDHSCIDPGIHSWIVRRWNAFMIASFSVVGLLASLFLGSLLLGISLTVGWVSTVVFFLICFFLQGRLSWLETMDMITFLTRVDRRDKGDIDQAPDSD